MALSTRNMNCNTGYTLSKISMAILVGILVLVGQYHIGFANARNLFVSVNVLSAGKPPNFSCMKRRTEKDCSVFVAFSQLFYNQNSR